MAKPFSKKELRRNPKGKSQMYREISPTGRSSSTSLVLSDKSEWGSELNEAVELFISASEAVVITELANTGTDILSVKSILEVSLRMKEARCELHAEPFDYSFDEPTFQKNATDQLSDLDDSVMADAFEDVGMCYPLLISGTGDACTDIILPQKNTEANSLDTKNVFCEDTIVIETQISKNHIESDTLGRCEVKDQDLNIGVRFEDESLLDIKISGNNLEVDLQQKIDAEGQRTNIDNLTWKDLSVENDEVIAFGDGISRKGVPRFYAAEFSFLSESLATGESKLVNKTEKGLQVIPCASRSACEDILSERSVGNRSYDGIGRFQDQIGSSDFELFDPLCSVVPCSISSDNLSTNIIYNHKILEATGKCFDPINGNIMLQCMSNIVQTDAPSSFFFIERSPFCKGTGVHYKNVPPSLKSRSIVAPGSDSILAGNVALHEMKISSSINHMSVGPLELKEGHQMLDESNSHCDVIGISSEKTDYQLSYKEPALESANGDPCKIQTFVNDNQFQDVNDEQFIHRIINHQSRHRVWARDALIDTEIENDWKSTSLLKINNTDDGINNSENKQTVESHFPFYPSIHLCPTQEQGGVSKRVRFSEAEHVTFPRNEDERPEFKYEPCLHTRRSKTEKRSCPSIFKGKKSLNSVGRLLMQCKKKLMFLGLEFLLTGYSRNKQLEAESLIRIHGGVVLANVPLASHKRAKRLSGCTSRQRPIVLSPKMVQTSKFLYGCAIRTWILDTAWLVDCIQAGRLLPPRKYMILQNPRLELNSVNGKASSCSEKPIFGMLNAMVYGKTRFCTRYSNIIKHGGGQICKTLQLLVQSVKDGENLVGVVLVEDESGIPRQLKHCVLEQNLLITSGSWIVDCLFSGKLLPLQKDQIDPSKRVGTLRYPEENADYMSEEI